MTDTNLAQSRTISKMAEALYASGTPAIQAQMETHWETVAEMQRAQTKLLDENARLRRLHAFLRQLVGGCTQAGDGATAIARRELVTWLLCDAGDLVVDLDEPVLIGCDDSETSVRKVASFIVTILCSESLPDVETLKRALRPRCRRDLGECGSVDCSCGSQREIEIPQYVVKALAEVRRG